MQADNKQQSGDITLRVIVLGIFLAILLAASSTYLALKVGILPSAYWRWQYCVCSTTEIFLKLI